MMRRLSRRSKLPPVENSLNSQNSKKTVSNKLSTERGRKEFILKFLILWAISAIVILLENLKDWLKASSWFSWLCGFLGTLLQMQMLLIPQLQFVFPLNYIVLIIATILMGFAAVLPLIGEPYWWMIATWGATVVISGIIVAVSVLKRFSMLRAFRKLIFSTFTMEIMFCIGFFPMIYLQKYDLIILVGGFAMFCTVVWEMAFIVQAILGDRRFKFRNDQHILCGLISAMFIIWMQLIISTETIVYFELVASITQSPTPVG
uniref:Uncharacterized protein n=1 Tax=Trichobilharzia regenti TaxID=157069 RepID=A0AA85IJX2_TRIRE|nr:unnamed protein product [Trichobilharzia regenti]